MKIDNSFFYLQAIFFFYPRRMANGNWILIIYLFINAVLKGITYLHQMSLSFACVKYEPKSYNDMAFLLLDKCNNWLINLLRRKKSSVSVSKFLLGYYKYIILYIGTSLVLFKNKEISIIIFTNTKIRTLIWSTNSIQPGQIAKMCKLT